jgi:transcriptional regulator with XRE-family HTH domain
MVDRRTPDDFQVALVLLRTLNGWNQKEFAKAAGLQNSQISLAESGRRPTAKTLSRLLETAGVSPSAFGAILGFLRRLRTGELDAPEGETQSTTLREVALALELAKDEILERCVTGESRDLEPAALAERLYAESKRVMAADPDRASELAELASRVGGGAG